MVCTAYTSICSLMAQYSMVHFLLNFKVIRVQLWSVKKRGKCIMKKATKQKKKITGFTGNQNPMFFFFLIETASYFRDDFFVSVSL